MFAFLNSLISGFLLKIHELIFFRMWGNEYRVFCIFGCKTAVGREMFCNEEKNVRHPDIVRSDAQKKEH